MLILLWVRKYFCTAASKLLFVVSTVSEAFVSLTIVTDLKEHHTELSELLFKLSCLEIFLLQLVFADSNRIK